jgi:hypothetical protein
MKDYNSYEVNKLEIINLNSNKNKLLRKYISSLNKVIVSLIIQLIITVILVLNLKKQICKMFFSLMEMISKIVEKYNKIVK